MAMPVVTHNGLVTVYFNTNEGKHTNEPHFHIFDPSVHKRGAKKKKDLSAWVDIETGAVEGLLSEPVASWLEGWLPRHRAQMMENWNTIIVKKQTEDVIKIGWNS